jgi:hypothetical protein
MQNQRKGVWDKQDLSRYDSAFMTINSMLIAFIVDRNDEQVYFTPKGYNFGKIFALTRYLPLL